MFYIKLHRLIFVLVLTYSVNLYSSDGLWLKQVTNTTKSISHIFFTDSLNGWAAGDSGLILHTSSGGNLWEIQNTNTDFFISDINFVNSSTGWALANNYYSWPDCTILKTTNSGANWIHYPFADTTLLLFAVCFRNELTGWAGGYSGKIMKTTDGGLNWSFHQPDSSEFIYNTIYSIGFYNDRFGVACGGIQDFAGVIWNVTNSGNNWLSKGLTSEPLYGVAFVDSVTAICVGGDFEFGTSILKTTDSGLNWSYELLNIFGVGRGLSFRTNNEAWIALSSSLTFCVSTNAGLNWYQIPTPDGSDIYDIQFVNERNGWAAGTLGAMYKYNSALIGINGNQTENAGNFIIYPAFPNPFNPSANISFKIFKNSSVKITIYDILGGERTVLTDGLLRAGEYKFKFDGIDLASGVYFCRINIDNNLVTKKLVLMK